MNSQNQECPLLAPRALGVQQAIVGERLPERQQCQAVWFPPAVLESLAEFRYVSRMDPLRADDIAYYSRLTPSERLRLALDMMRDGIAMHRANLRRRHADASEETIEAMLRLWMLRE